MSKTNNILLTIPKYVTISPNPSQQQKLLAPAVHRTEVIQGPLSSKNVNQSTVGRGKKRRLDHLSWEEKVQRKKLKNRVAAQTSRDRKKAKMDNMEETIKILTEQTENLKNKCENLQAVNQALLEKNQKLDLQVESLQKQLDEMKYNDENKQFFRLNCKELNEVNDVNASCANVGLNCHNSIRSAVSSDINNPLPKGKMELKTTLHENINIKDKSAETTASLWKIIALCLLYKTYSKISIQENWKNLPKAYSQISPQTWKMIIQQAATHMPKVRAIKSDCLDQWWGPQQKAWNPSKIQTVQA